MNRNFDFYEYAGFIVPGAVIIVAAIWLFPESRALLSKEGVTLGEFGLFVVIAYAAGQLVQAVGNGLEWIWWKPQGGMPSIRVLCGKYLSTEQHKRLLEALALGSEMRTRVDCCSPRDSPSCARCTQRSRVPERRAGSTPSPGATASCAASPPRLL
jgi:hypothetical protein